MLLFMLKTYFFFCKITIFRRHAMPFVTKIMHSVERICSFIEKTFDFVSIANIMIINILRYV